MTETAAKNLYGRAILEHNRSPRNYGPLPGPARRAARDNPQCGDSVAVYLLLEGGRAAALSFEAEGCALCRASASMMTEALRGKESAEALRLCDGFLGMIGGKPASGGGRLAGELLVFSVLSGHPSRVACAALAWEAARELLKPSSSEVFSLPAEPSRYKCSPVSRKAEDG